MLEIFRLTRYIQVFPVEFRTTGCWIFENLKNRELLHLNFYVCNLVIHPKEQQKKSFVSESFTWSHLTSDELNSLLA